MAQQNQTQQFLEALTKLDLSASPIATGLRRGLLEGRAHITPAELNFMIANATRATPELLLQIESLAENCRKVRNTPVPVAPFTPQMDNYFERLHQIIGKKPSELRHPPQGISSEEMETIRHTLDDVWSRNLDHITLKTARMIEHHTIHSGDVREVGKTLGAMAASGLIQESSADKGKDITRPGVSMKFGHR